MKSNSGSHYIVTIVWASRNRNSVLLSLFFYRAALPHETDVCCYMCLYRQPFTVSTGNLVCDEDIRANETSHLLTLQSCFKQNIPKYEPRLDSVAQMQSPFISLWPCMSFAPGLTTSLRSGLLLLASSGLSPHESRTKLLNDTLVRLVMSYLKYSGMEG